MSCFVDTDYADCRVTRRSHWYIDLCQEGTNLWYLKRQNNVEAEFMAATVAVEMI
jgi:hypothetical protein